MTPKQQQEVWTVLDHARLAEVARKGPEPVFATISGAHLYGFASPDSDVDLRGAFMLPARELLGRGPGRSAAAGRGPRANVTVETGELPFDAEVRVEVRAVRVEESIAEPVPTLRLNSGSHYVEWDAVAAASYAVFVRNVQTDETVEYGPTTGTSFSAPANLVSFEVWVVSINSLVERSAFPSDRAQGIIIDPT